MGKARTDRQWILVILLLGGAGIMVLALLFPGWFAEERSGYHSEAAAPAALDPSRSGTPDPGESADTQAAAGPEAGASADLPPYGDRGLAKAESIRGRVIDKDGRAVKDAIVVAAYKETRTRPFEVVLAGRVRSEEDGFFVLGPLDRRTYVVLALEPKAGVGYRGNLLPGAWVEIVLAPGATVAGTVTARESGAPVPNARVLVVDATYQHATVTDADGKYVLAPLPAALNAWMGQRVLVVADGFRRAERNNLLLRPGAEQRVDFALEPGVSLKGTVVDARTLRPIAGAVVGEGWEPFHRTVTAGADGAYALPNVETAPNNVFTARADGFLPQERQSDGSGTIEFRLDASLELAGVVKDPQDRPVEGARVYLHRLPEPGRPAPPGANRGGTFTTSGDEGRFLFRDVQPGKVALVAFSDSFAPGEHGPIELHAGAPPPPGLQVVLRHGVTVEGEVRDLKDQPIPDMRVQLQRWGGRIQGYKYAQRYIWSEQPSWYSDEKGRFVLKGAIPGRLFLTAWDTTYGWASTRMEGKEGERVTDVVISFAGATIEGVFLSAEGEPIPGANVQARGPKNTPKPQWRWTQTDSLGRFRLGGLKDGAYDLSANSTYGNPKQLKDIQAGATGVELKLEVNHVLAGTVTSVLSGRALERFTLSIQPKRKATEASRMKRSLRGGGRGTRWQGELRTPDGRFERPVTPGTYTLTVKAPGHAPRVVDDVIVEERVAPAPVHFALDGGGGIRGTVSDAEGKPLAGVHLNARVYRAPGEQAERSDWLLGGTDRTDSKGRYFIEGLAPGMYLVELNFGRRGSARAQATVTGRERVQADLRLLPTGTVTLKAVDESGQPVPGVMFQFWDEAGRQFVGWAMATNAQGTTTSQPLRMGPSEVRPFHQKRPGQDTYTADRFTVDVPPGGNLVVEVVMRKKEP